MIGPGPLPPSRVIPVHRLIAVDMREVPALLAGIGKIVIGGFEGKAARLVDARIVHINEARALAWVQTHYQVIVDGEG